MAPHGGIFVVLLLSKPILFLLFILIVSGVVFGLLKAPEQTVYLKDPQDPRDLAGLFILDW